MRLLTTSVTIVLTISLANSCSSSESVDQPQKMVAEEQTVGISETHESNESEDKEELKESIAVGTTGLATYDESIPDGGYEAYYIYHQNVESLSRASDIIFIGRITNYLESVLSVPQPETSSIGLQKNVYDGIVFTVDQLLAGEMLPNRHEITVLTFALVTDAQGSPMVRISDSPIEVVRSGIEQRNLLDGPTYLVFAVQEEDRSSPFYRSDFYYFNTPGSIVEVLDDGFLGIGVDKPLSSARVAEGETSEPVNSLLMADVRGAVNVTQETSGPPGSQPQNEGPGGLLTDSTPGETSTE